MFVDLPGNGVLKKMNFHAEGVNLSHDWFDIILKGTTYTIVVIIAHPSFCSMKQLKGVWQLLPLNKILVHCSH